MNLRDLLGHMIEKGASDLHISAGLPPMFRVDGQMTRVGEDRVEPEMGRKLAYSIMNEDQRSRFEKVRELDFSFGIPNLSRFRAKGSGSFKCALSGPHQCTPACVTAPW